MPNQESRHRSTLSSQGNNLAIVYLVSGTKKRLILLYEEGMRNDSLICAKLIL